MQWFMVLLILLFASCGDKPVNSGPAFGFYPGNPDSVLYWRGWKDEITNNASLFNLPLLFNGTDSFELRVWPWQAFDPTRRVLIFKVDSAGWSGFNFNSYSSEIHSRYENLTGPDPKVLGKNVFLAKRLVPKSGWDLFADSLNLSGIKTLPTEGDIKNYKYRAFLDGYGFVFEIATKHSYRILTYNLPYDCDYEECKKVVAFLSYLEREFGLDYCWPNCWKVGEPNPLAPK